ncbi:MAG: efflux RND transporter periplasmic adaptor subunit [Bacteroidales bacterium]|nr:efflux RND transporter periplasmic adaptor subunit [Bacteroidales bacterium]
MKQQFRIIAATFLLLSSCGQKNGEYVRPNHHTITISLETADTEQTYSAAIQGKQDIAIMPQVGGFLTRLNVHEGATVKKGDVLFEIDRVNFEAALRVAEANVEAAEAMVRTNELTYKSKQKLFDEGVISQYDLQVAENALLTARAGLAQANASVVNARQNLSYCTVKAPCSGVVGRLPLRVGSLVSPQMPEPLTTVSDNSEMYVYFSMTEQQMLSLIRQYGSLEEAIKNMPDVSLQISDGATYDHNGRIESISGVIDRSTGAVSVRAVFPNPERLLMSGGACNVVIPSVSKDVIVIPQEATYEIQDKVFCFRVVDGKAVSTPISVKPLSDGRRYIVAAGLQVGETIVAEGAGLIKDGDEIVAL